MKEKKCVYCGAIFYSKYKNQKYCGKECREQDALVFKEEKRRRDFIIFSRDNFRCCYCGKSPIEDNKTLVVEHVIPRYLGGNNSLYNTVSACTDCNSGKGLTPLSSEIVLRIIRRNIKYCKGLSSKQRNKIKQAIAYKFPNENDNESIVSVFNRLYNHK